MSKIRRIAFFSAWDRDGVFDQYALTYIKSLKKVAEKVVITVNGRIEPDSLKAFYELTDYVYIRPNFGLDAGAGKDSVLWAYESGELEEYDEMIYSNDSSFGPFYPLEEAFEAFKNQDVDFWPLVEVPSVSISRGGKKIKLPHHMQGFFFVVRKPMFEDYAQFLRSVNYPKCLLQASLETEFPFAELMEEKGHKWKSYMTLQGLDNTKVSSQIMENSVEMVTKYRMPFIKKRFVNPTFYSKYKELLNYVDLNTDYDTNQIYEHIDRIESIDSNVHGYNSIKLKEFCESHKRIFVYGNGEYGSEVGKYLKENLKFDGFLITKGDSNKDVQIYNNFNKNEGDGIIVGVGFDTGPYHEIIKTISCDFEEKDIFKPRG